MTRNVPSSPDRTGRVAALWATAIAVPLALVVGVVAVTALRPHTTPPAKPGASATPRAQSSAPVPVAAAALAQRPATVCRALVSRLPATLQDLAQRPVTAGPEQNAAYGDPALTVRCGVPAVHPAPTDDVYEVNGVCWYPVEQPDRVVLTTLDREAPVELSVPRQYAEALQWAAPVSTAAVEAVPHGTGPVPSGCTG